MNPGLMFFIPGVLKNRSCLAVIRMSLSAMYHHFFAASTSILLLMNSELPILSVGKRPNREKHLKLSQNGLNILEPQNNTLLWAVSNHGDETSRKNIRKRKIP